VIAGIAYIQPTFLASYAIDQSHGPVQMGASLTVGTAIICAVVPAKMGFAGLLMMFWACFKESVMPAGPAFLFVPIFAIATDVISFLRPAASATRVRAPIKRD
jgi:hypothetical protein